MNPRSKFDGDVIHNLKLIPTRERQMLVRFNHIRWETMDSAFQSARTALNRAWSEMDIA
jgi:hypothetical protein